MGRHDTTSDGWTPITREGIRAALEAFVEWETDDRSEVLQQSAALFVVEMSGYAMTIGEAKKALFCDGPTVPVERVIDVAHKAALIADKVEASADPGDGKDAADEIGRRIRALMQDGQ